MNCSAISNLKIAVFLVFFVLLSSCDGGMGCSGCTSGCGIEMQPIPGDFPLDKRIENSAQLHVNRSAFDFLEDNIDEIKSMYFPEGVYFDIPPTTQNIARIGEVVICPDGGCTVNAQILNLSIVPFPPSGIKVVFQVRVIINDLPVRIKQGLLCLCWDDCDCSVDFDTADSGRPYNSFSATFVFTIDSVTGYTSLKMQDAGVEDDLENGDLSITNSNFCGLGVCSVANIGFIKDFLLNSIEQNLADSLRDPFNQAMCRQCGAGCPDGSTCSGTNPDDLCMYPDDTCVPSVLGAMGRMDIGSLLASISPSTRSVVDMVFAAGGYAEVSASPDTIDMGFYGGMEAAPPDECVRRIPVACEVDSDCAEGFTCTQLEEPPSYVFACRRCGDGCPEGSHPSKSLPCQPGTEAADYDPSQVCVYDDDPETCVPLRYCVGADGAMQTTPGPAGGVVPVAESLKVETFTHCVFCDTDDDCTAPYKCNEVKGVCLEEGQTDVSQCETVTEPVMVVMGISRSYLKRAVYGIVSSGAMCLEIPPGSIPQLTSDLMKTAIPALGNVIWDSAPLALVIRPSISDFQTERVEFDALDSPDVKISDSPLLSVFFNDLTIDFYSWIEDTYSRFLTATFDLMVNVDLYVKDNSIVPIIRNPTVRDVRVYNSDLVLMDSDALRDTMGGIIELAMGFMPAVNPIEITSFEKLQLVIPDGGVVHIEDSGEDFLVFYVNLGIVPDGGGSGYRGAGDTIEPVETHATVIDSYIPDVDLSRGTAQMFQDCDGKPYFVVKFDTPDKDRFDCPIQYRYRLNGGPWSSWSLKDTIKLTSRQFIFQTHHKFEAQARPVCAKSFVDPTPAVVDILVDGMRPDIEVIRAEGDSIEITAHDLQTSDDRLEIYARKVRDIGGTLVADGWEKVKNGQRIKLNDDYNLVAVDVRAIDEAGNSSTDRFEIRGRVPPPEGSGGCGSCGIVQGERGGGPLTVPAGAFVVIFLLALVFLRGEKKRRKRSDFVIKRICYFVVLLAFLLVYLSTNGCSCNERENPCEGRQGPDCCLTDDDCGSEDMVCCSVDHKCMELPEAIQSPPAPESVAGKYNQGCEAGYFCEDLPEFVVDEEAGSCYFDWSCCEEAGPLVPGRLGTHLSMDVKQEGGSATIWLSGYSPGRDEYHRYGDLVAGMWNGESKEVAWEILDGVPEDGFITNSTTGWRGGVEEEGDDVGLYTSVVLNENGSPMISYYDRTNTALKFIEFDGQNWSKPEFVDGSGNEDCGLFGKMIAVPSGEVVIVYRASSYEEKDHPGEGSRRVVHIKTMIRVAKRSGQNWEIETLMEKEETPCWGGGCPEGYVCRVEDKLCWQPESAEEHPDECSSCGADQECLVKLDSFGAATSEYGCEDVITVADVPEGIGLWNDIAVSSAGDLEVVSYDRTDGNLIWLHRSGGIWQEPVILDGDENAPDPEEHGDRGWSPAIAVDSNGNRHIVYVDGIKEEFLYMEVGADGEVVTKEIIDDGVDVFNNEKDLVGDNSSIGISSSGQIRVVYQNTSDGVLMMAIRNSDSTWTRSEITDVDAGFAGYYANQVIVGDNSYVGYFYYNYESPPTSVGVMVLLCNVGVEGVVNCS